MFAIGANGRSWFKRALYNELRIVDFGYFVPPPAAPDEVHTSLINSPPDVFTVGFLGRHEKTKGFHLYSKLAQAFQHNPNVRYYSAGIGSLSSRCPSNITMLGAVPNSSIYSYLSSLNLLIIPSISDDDGWCVAASESLLCGTPILISEKAGASLLSSSTLLAPYVTSFRPCYSSLYPHFLPVRYIIDRQLLQSISRDALSVDKAANFLQHLLGDSLKPNYFTSSDDV